MKKGQHIKEAAVASKDAEKPPYEPTPIEAEAIAAYRAAKETRGPRIKVSIEGDVAKINQDHPDLSTFGTNDLLQKMFDAFAWLRGAANTDEISRFS